MGGGGIKLMKSFNYSKIPAQLFIIFTTGGLDFVGGNTYYQFLKTFKFGASTDSLGKVKLTQSSGEEVHKAMFEDSSIKTPEHWKKMINYF